MLKMTFIDTSVKRRSKFKVMYVNPPLCFMCLYGTVLEAAEHPGTVLVAGNGSGNVMEILGNLMKFCGNPKDFTDSVSVGVL